KNTELHFRLGVVYDKWNKKEASIESMKTVISLDPQNANALNYIGYTYAELGINLDEAERLIKEALKYMPDDGYITDSLGWVYYKKGLYKEALKFLKKAVNLVPDDPTILEHMGDTYLKINDKKKALMFYERSLLNREKDKAGIEKKIQELK
ncbi:MAG: tetratricopeptide repeat protein, partial [Proteobacteria bacterium]|nr:tetratricopeptide repeat protein [Pseudomonadota bacterium]